MKSLSESLFDSDLVSKKILMGEIVELEEWECADVNDYDKLESATNSSFSAKLKNKLIKTPKWKKFLSPFESVYDKRFGNLQPREWSKYLNCWLMWAFTWVVMCCSSLKEIPTKLNEFIKGIKRSINMLDDDLYINSVDIIPLEGLGDMKSLPRMVVFKFKTTDRDIVIYMKLKKRDL